MKCIILAAGYATRMYPLTENFPKPLLEIQGKPILEWILEDINRIKEVDEIIIVSNHKFIAVFEEWKKGLAYSDRIQLLDDGSTENENRLGAVRDIALCIERNNIKDDVLVLAGDNLVDFSFQEFVSFFYQKRTSCIMVHREESVEKLRRTGVAVLDGDGRLIEMQEKPENPASHFAVPPFYIYRGEELGFILEGIKQGRCQVDSPGSLIKWLCTEREVYACPMNGRRYDIGNLEIYEQMKGHFPGTVKITDTCDIMGVHIAVTNMEKTLHLLENNLEEWRGKYICVANVHTTVTAFEDETYRAVQNGAVMTLPDGGPLSRYSREHGFKDAQRVTGPDLMREVLKISVRKGWKHYFYGSTQETLDLLKKKIEESYPGTQIAGMYSPPFRELTQEEDMKIVDMINEAKPDFVWVGLGAPKQERWMAAHENRVNAVMTGVGAAFDYEAGNIKRAPAWMQKCSLEWLYRLMQDPKRLFKRYFVTNFKYMWWKIRH